MNPFVDKNEIYMPEFSPRSIYCVLCWMQHLMKLFALFFRKIGFYALMLCMPLCFAQQSGGELHGNCAKHKVESEASEIIWVHSLKICRKTSPRATDYLASVRRDLSFDRLRKVQIFVFPQIVPPSPSAYRNLPMLC